MQYQAISNVQRGSDFLPTPYTPIVPLRQPALVPLPTDHTSYCENFPHTSFTNVQQPYVSPVAPSSPWPSSSTPAYSYVPSPSAELATPKASKDTEMRTPRPPNAFILYRTEKSRTLRNAEGPKRPQSEVSKLVGQMWKNETPESRAQWEQKARDVKAEHSILYPDYRFKPLRKTAVKHALSRLSSQNAMRSSSSKKSLPPCEQPLSPRSPPSSSYPSSSRPSYQAHSRLFSPYEVYRTHSPVPVRASYTPTHYPLRRSSSVGLVDAELSTSKYAVRSTFPLPTSWSSTSYSSHANFPPCTSSSGGEGYFSDHDFSLPPRIPERSYVTYPAFSFPESPYYPQHQHQHQHQHQFQPQPPLFPLPLHQPRATYHDQVSHPPAHASSLPSPWEYSPPSSCASSPLSSHESLFTYLNSNGSGVSLYEGPERGEGREIREEYFENWVR